MQLPTIKDLVLPAKMVYFARYQDGALWYRCENGFEFPIYTNDPAATGIFLPEHKAVSFMRWINDYLKYLTKAMEGTNE